MQRCSALELLQSGHSKNDTGAFEKKLEGELSGSMLAGVVDEMLIGAESCRRETLLWRYMSVAEMC